MAKFAISWFGKELGSGDHLYRYLPLHRAIQLFETAHLSLVLPVGSGLEPAAVSRSATSGGEIRFWCLLDNGCSE